MAPRLPNTVFADAVEPVDGLLLPWLTISYSLRTASRVKNGHGAVKSIWMSLRAELEGLRHGACDGRGGNMAHRREETELNA
jgi:hypothetical protein